MKLKLSCSVLAFIILLQPKPSLTESTPDENSMLQGCGYTAMEEAKMSPQQWTDALTCIAYIRGIIEGYTVANAQLMSKHRKLCVPDEVKPRQEALVIHKYLQEHPEKLHEPEAILAIEALQKAFPCTK